MATILDPPSDILSLQDILRNGHETSGMICSISDDLRDHTGLRLSNLY